ncbi:MAG: PilZ domain-containing protein [Leptospiraceae bacterium]|nr:PilZ domain-containing protein [Leptospiraceae bacterium]MCK6380056.1 PilZ domain-containing protein [Leptospiraceae bacterium]NUM40649.1 PilZ domain-containing protein [Leptospiraceae bacterium]
MDDNRLFKRFKKNNLIKLCVSDKEFFGNLEDISMMGCSIKTENKLQIGEDIVLESYFFSEKLPCEVLRLNQDGEENKYGLRFNNLSENIVKEIYDLITVNENS